MNEEKQTVDPYKFGYDDDQNWIIPAKAGLMMIDFMNEVVASQPNIGALLVYPKKVEEIKDEQGNIIFTDIEWEEHNASSFFATASQQNGAVPFMTSIAFKAEQLKQSLGLIHAENIKKGIAKPVEQLKSEDALSKLQ